MNNYTFKKHSLCCSRKTILQSPPRSDHHFSLLHGLKLSCCLSIFQGKHPQSYMSWLRVAVRFWVIGLFPFAPNYTVCQSIHVLKDIFYQKQYLYTVHSIHFFALYRIVWILLLSFSFFSKSVASPALL